MVLLSILNSFVFLLPADSGEKISFLVSIFVTYAVFLNFVSDLIPKNKNQDDNQYPDEDNHQKHDKGVNTSGEEILFGLNTFVFRNPQASNAISPLIKRISQGMTLGIITLADGETTDPSHTTPIVGMKTLCLFVCMVHASQGRTLEEHLQASRKEALANYPRNVITYECLMPDLKFVPLSIAGLDELTQTFSFTAMFSFKWQDPNLKLNVNLSEFDWENKNVLVSYTSQEIRTPFSNEITFHLKRQASFYVLGIVFPMVLLSILNSFVFLLPADSGEKISFLVSIFVTYAVFLNFVSDLIPKSDRLPRLALYLVLVQCHSTLCILATLFILNRHHKKANDDAKEHENRNKNQPDNQYPDEDNHQKHGQGKKMENISVLDRATRPMTFKTVERRLFFVFLVLAAATLLVLFV
ncbi:uncharacterized protein [Haliotis cracherodii]|uniref:uncharacterized protein n=1 Tax=Haliotis cracherodii TaxID=6455 RepID=UPI0039EC4AF6